MTATDGNSHSVQIYSDITAEWVAGDITLPVNWSTATGGTLVHQVQLQNQTVFAEATDRALCRTPALLIADYIDLL